MMQLMGQQYLCQCHMKSKSCEDECLFLSLLHKQSYTFHLSIIAAVTDFLI